MTSTCDSCQAPLPPSYLKCPKCGWKRAQSSSLPSTALAPSTNPTQRVGNPLSMPGVAPYSVATPSFIYAGFWRRVGAVVVDSLVLGLGQVAINLSLSLLLMSWQLGALFGSFVGVLIAFFYEAYFLSSPRCATPGKMALGIRVVDDQGRRITFGRALGRSLLKICNIFTAGLGYLAAAFTQRKQALHDFLVNTVVIR